MRNCSKRQADTDIDDVIALPALVHYRPGAVVSRTVVSKAGGKVTAFAFDADEGSSEHTAPFGPLDLRDLAQQLLPYLDYSTAYIGPLQAEWQSFVLQKLCSICGTALAAGRGASPDGRAHPSCST